jgi:hypothetical protein
MVNLILDLIMYFQEKTTERAPDYDDQAFNATISMIQLNKDVLIDIRIPYHNLDWGVLTVKIDDFNLHAYIYEPNSMPFNVKLISFYDKDLPNVNIFETN